MIVMGVRSIQTLCRVLRRGKAELNPWLWAFRFNVAVAHKGARAMIEKRVGQLETDVRILAKLETEVHEMQQAIQGLARQVADLKMHSEEMRHIGFAARALS
jgi:hypothetical protein